MTSFGWWAAHYHLSVRIQARTSKNMANLIFGSWEFNFNRSFRFVLAKLLDHHFFWGTKTRRTINPIFSSFIYSFITNFQFLAKLIDLKYELLTNLTLTLTKKLTLTSLNLIWTILIIWTLNSYSAFSFLIQTMMLDKIKISNTPKKPWPLAGDAMACSSGVGGRGVGLAFQARFATGQAHLKASCLFRMSFRQTNACGDDGSFV